MSRIGKLPIIIPAGVTITHKDDIVTVKGPKGELSQYVNPAIKVTIEDGKLTMEENEELMQDNTKQRHAFHGLYRSLVNNMVVGVSEGYKKTLQIVGVGYRVSNQGNLLEFALGYSHAILFEVPKEIKVETGILENECRELNKRFFTYHEKKRPYIILKWAQTADGYIDTERDEKTCVT